MRKRPLAFLCLAVLILLSLFGERRRAGRNDDYREVQEYLVEIAGEENTLTFEGTVTQVQAVSEGVRLLADQIVIDTKDNSKYISDRSNYNSDRKSVSTQYEYSDVSSVFDGQVILSSNLNLSMNSESDVFLPGDRIRVTGKYYPIDAAGNPGQFDSVEYYFSLDSVGRIVSPEIIFLAEGSGGVKRLLARSRRTLRNSYLRILEEKAARTVSAISLGEKSFMEQEWKQLYQEGGIAHIISISGLHISMIGMCVYRLLRCAGVSFSLASMPSALVVFLYAMMSGFSFSAMRACLMFMIWLGAQITGRKYDMITGTAVAAVFILVTDCTALWQSSFLLTFGAILSIALLTPRLQEANPFRARKEKRTCRREIKMVKKQNTLNSGTMPYLIHQARHGLYQVWNLVCGGSSVWLGTLPVTLWFFYQTSPWSIIVNLAVIPLMSSLMASALISCFAGLISIPAGMFLSAPVYYLLGLFEWLCHLEQKLPCAVWIAGRPAVWKLVAYYALLAGAALLSWKPRRKKTITPGTRTEEYAGEVFRISNAFVWIAAITIGIGLMVYHPCAALTVTCMDVGQGDGALLQMPDGVNCLIDGGSTSVSGLWEYRISQTVRYYGISTIDYVFLSHADSDHISGILEYLEDYLPGFGGKNAHGITVKHLVIPPTADETDFEELIEKANTLGISVLRMEAGAALGNIQGNTDTRNNAGRMSLGYFGKNASLWSLTCLAPSSSNLSGDKNEDSMVLLLQYGAFRMLFTGDLENEAETALASSGMNLSCDILKVGHHGSNGASSEEFLAAASPAFGIISCGANNRYGHPGVEAVERLLKAGITLYTTMECGALTVRSDGTAFSLEGFLNTTAYTKN